MENITRRKFLGVGVGAGLTMAAAKFGTPSNLAEAQVPRRGGTLRVALSGAPTKLDPPTFLGIDDFVLGRSLYDSLTFVDHNLVPRPELAESWEASPDPRTWIFHLRRGVRFHHNREMDADDVVYTYRRILDPKTASPARVSLSVIEKVEKLDKYTVRFVLNIPYADLPVLLGGNFHAKIIPHDRSDLDKNPSGTGPFKLKEFVPGDRTTLVRNDAYWQADRPYLDEVRYLYMPEMASQVAGVIGGTLDMIHTPSAEVFPILESNPSVKVLTVASNAYQPIVMRMDRAPFNDNRVRLALKYCVDRAAMNRIVLRGHGSLGNDHPIPPTSEYWTDMGIRPRDIAKAKELLADAGYSNGLDLELFAWTGRPGLVEQALTFQDMVKPANIRIQVRTLPSDVFLSKYYLKVDFFLSHWNARAALDELLFIAYHSKAKWNESYWIDPDLDRLLESGRAELDFQKRKAFYAQIQKKFIEEGPVIIAYHRPRVTAMRKNVIGFQPHPSGWSDLRSVWLG